LPDGRTAAQAATPELLEALPKLLTGAAWTGAGEV